MKRSVINIDQDKCTGCGLCIPGCPEGAIQLIDGKARLISDLLCDGLGACIGECPEGAISVEEREAEPYDELKVIEGIVKQGPNTLRAHLDHLKQHGQHDYLATALGYLQDHGVAVPAAETAEVARHSGCPGSKSMAFTPPVGPADTGTEGSRPSRLTHWPIQLHLLSPAAPHFQGADLLLAADCVAYTVGDFHKDWLRNRVLAIACPKLDHDQDVYLRKLIDLIDVAKVNTITVMIMQVPCCRGLLALAQQATAQAKRKVPVKSVVVGLQGEILGVEWL